MTFREIEFKYKATDIGLTAFTDFNNFMKPLKYIEASGYDYFYDSPKDEAGFYRLRIGHDIFQLTYKRKTTNNNNFIRDEDNLDIQKESTSKDQLEAHIKRHGYTFNSRIFKNCFIFKYDLYTLVYYICYNPDMEELGRFIEIEMSEGHPWGSDQEAYSNLLVIEKLHRSLGLVPQARIRKSLYELFKKD